MKEQINEIYLQPGEYFWGGERNRVKTLLGSCVAICIWHPTLKIGGMSHCLLPTRGHGSPRVGERTEPVLSGKYVDECLEIFFREMARAGTRKQDYVVKVFGGGNMFELKDPSGATVGERNIEMLQIVLARESIAIAAQHMGGKGHRNVVFELWNGDCWVKHADMASITGREKSPAT